MSRSNGETRSEDGITMKKIRLLVCGGRDYHNETELFGVLDRIVDRVDVLIHGAARGADSVAHRWAEARGIPIESYPANWNKHGRAAGPIRNTQMLEEGRPDLVVAFCGGRGTQNMISQSKERGVPVEVVSCVESTTDSNHGHDAGDEHGSRGFLG